MIGGVGVSCESVGREAGIVHEGSEKYMVVVEEVR